MPGRKEYRARIDALKNMVEVQSRTGNADYDEYMYGMAQGMILALSIVDDTECVYLDRPELFRSEYDIIDKFNKSGIVLDNPN